MASTFDLVRVLRGLDSGSLTERLRHRVVPRPGQVHDAFDLAEALLDPGSIRAALSRLDRTELLMLQALRHPSAVDLSASAAARDRLVELLLVAPGGGNDVETLDLVASTLDHEPALSLAALQASEKAGPPLSPERPRVAADAPASTERLSAIVLEVAELLRELAEAPARELAKGGLALPETRRVSAATRVDVENVADLLSIARAAGLVELSRAGWGASARAADWLLLPWPERWGALVAGFLDELPREIRRLIDRRPDESWGAPLHAFASWSFPAGDDWIDGSLTAFGRTAALLGLIDDEQPTPVATTLLTAGLPAAQSMVAGLMPTPVTELYLQNDLTAVSTGPLASALDARLRVLAELESGGLAATYRITEDGIRRALSNGESETGLRTFLEGISRTGIPQPLDYLLTETAARHGRYRVSAVDPAALPAAGPLWRNARSQLRSDDSDLIEMVEVDQALRALGLHRLDTLRLLSDADPDVVYWALADARYPVLIEDAEHTPLPAPERRSLRPAAPPGPPDPLPELVGRVVASSTGSADDTERAWIARQLDAAVKARRTIVVTIVSPDGSGSTSELQLEPTGVGGGRLRGRDRRSDIERTLPLSSIVGVSTATV